MPNLTNPIILQAQLVATSFRIERSEDCPGARTVRACVVLDEETQYKVWLTVWSGDDYDAAGQWTDTSLSNAVKAQLDNNGLP